MDKKKRNIIIAVTAAVIVLVAAVTAIALNMTSIKINLTYAMMPESITQECNGKNVTFYVRKNKDYQVKTQEEVPLEAFEFYYYDDDGKEVNLGSDGVYIDGDSKTMPSLLFMIRAMQKYNGFKTKYLPIITVAVVVITVAVIIGVWYKLWSAREEKEKQLKYKNNKHPNKKK